MGGFAGLTQGTASPRTAMRMPKSALTVDSAWHHAGIWVGALGPVRSYLETGAQERGQTRCKGTSDLQERTGHRQVRESRGG